MRKSILLSAIGSLCVFCVAAAPKSRQVERGKYLVGITGCNDCHTPTVPGPGGMPVPDATRLLSGHPEGLPYPAWTPADMEQRNAMALTGRMLTAWAGPWGVSFAANLTPDKATGLGDWTEAAFIRMIRLGKHQGQPNGRDILPPMPVPDLKEATDADLKAIFAYLRSIPPIKNQVPFSVPPAALPK